MKLAVKSPDIHGFKKQKKKILPNFFCGSERPHIRHLILLADMSMMFQDLYTFWKKCQASCRTLSNVDDTP